MRKRVVMILLLLVLPMIVGCPGNRPMDKEASDALWAWVEQQDSTRWDIVGAPNTNYNHVIIDHRFRPTKLDIAINGDAVNPIHQRNMLEQIARQWRNSYPANLRPRFNLRVEIYNKEISKATELGYTEVDTDGNVDTHHSATQDVN
jgi:hypothetical protein